MKSTVAENIADLLAPQIEEFKDRLGSSIEMYVVVPRDIHEHMVGDFSEADIHGLRSVAWDSDRLAIAVPFGPPVDLKVSL